MKKNEFPTALVRPVIRTLKPYSSARDEFNAERGGMVFLDANENPYPTDVNRYPDPHQRKLRTLIAANSGLTEESLFLGNGSDDVLDLLFRVLCEPYKDRIITTPPTFGMFKVLADIHCVENLEVPLDEAFQPDVDAILARATANTKMLFLVSPNNPTGNCMDREPVLTLAREFPGLVVVDQAYAEFSDYPGFDQDVKDHPNLVVTRTFSKAYGLAGLRLGLAVAHPELIGYLKRVKLPYNVNELTQQRALESLQDLSGMQAQVREIRSERGRLELALAGISFISEVFPSEANFLMVRVDDADRRYRELLEMGIVVRNTSGKYRCPQTLRVTVGTPGENELLLNALIALSKNAMA